MVSVAQKRIFLSDSFWKFRYIFDDTEILDKYYKEGLPNDSETLKVYVPSSWSYYQNRKNFYHFGRGIYEMSFYLPYAWGSGDGKKIKLIFDGSNYKTTIWINGKKVGFHEGGYTQFWFTINEFVSIGTENKIIVEVDNRYLKEYLPWGTSPEWMIYGGIYRPVYLNLTSKVCIEDYKITDDFQFDKPIGLKPEKWHSHLNIRVLIKNNQPQNKKFEGSLISILTNHKTSISSETPIKLEEIEEKFIDISLNIINPELWTPDNPNLYNIDLILVNKLNREEIDRERVLWGFKEFKIIKNDFYLNNLKINLRGISRHEDHADVGSSMNPRLIYNDLNIMKEAHINCIRTSHYPPQKSLLEFADEMGFLVIEEIPVHKLKDDNLNSEILEKASQQVWEMIHRDKNHCSIIAWMISSDCETSSKEIYEFSKTLIEISRSLDPYRYHTLATKNVLYAKTLDIVDFVCFNLSKFWYDKYDLKPENIFPLFDEIQEKIENLQNTKPLVISKFGSGAIAGFKSFANAHWSENYQHDLLKTFLDVIIDKKFIAGTLIWHFQDFRCSPKGGFQNKPKEYNNTGIVDIHRNPKISYNLVQEKYLKWKNQNTSS